MTGFLTEIPEGQWDVETVGLSMPLGMTLLLFKCKRAACSGAYKGPSHLPFHALDATFKIGTSIIVFTSLE